MHSVYILQSIKFPEKIYKGFTRFDIKTRLVAHNRGEVISTRKYRPWRVIFIAFFDTQELAIKFEKYLKTASGIAFARKRLIIKK